MSVILFIVNLPLGLFRWIWNLAHAGVLRARLHAEFAQVRELRDMATQQLQQLYSSPSNMIQLKLVAFRPVHYDVRKETTEPYVSFHFELFNLSVHSLSLSNVGFAVQLYGRPLPQAPNLFNFPRHLYPCASASFDITQPITRETADHIMNRIGTPNPVIWRLEVRAAITVPPNDRPRSGAWAIDLQDIPPI